MDDLTHLCDRREERGRDNRRHQSEKRVQGEESHPQVPPALAPRPLAFRWDESTVVDDSRPSRSGWRVSENRFVVQQTEEREIRTKASTPSPRPPLM